MSLEISPPIPLPNRRQATAFVQGQIQQQTGVAIPTSVQQGAKQLQQLGKTELEKLAQQAGIPTNPQQVQQQFERFAKKEIGKLSKKIGVGEAQQIGKKLLREMGVSDIPFALPKDLTVGGVRDAAINAGMGRLESLLQQQTGLPIPLPRSLDPEEIVRSFGSVLPADAAEAIELGLQLGAQYAGSAIASALAGAAIGSTIPGLGTVLGIGIALGVEAMREALKEVPPHAVECKTRVRCQMPPGNPLDVLPWAAAELHLRLMPALSKERAKKYCGRGEIVVCSAYYSTVSRNAFNVSKSTPMVLGLPELQRLIPLYQNASKTAPHFNPKTRRIEIIKTGIAQDMEGLLAAMLLRQKQLQTLVSGMAQVERLSPRDFSSLRWTLITEMRNAAMQVQFQPRNQGVKAWLGQVGQMWQRYQNRQAGTLQQRKQTQQVQQQRFQAAQSDPKKVLAHKLQQLQLACSDGNQAACAEYRKLAAGQKPTGKAQSPAPRPAQRGVNVAETQARQLANAWLNAWAKKTPAKARCLTPKVRESLIALFVAAHAKKTVPVSVATQRITAILGRPC